MATKQWRGDQPAVAQVNTITVGGTPANNQVYSVTFNSKTVSYTANGTDTNSTIATALQALLQASTIPEFGEALYSVNAAVITATGKTAGMPFTNTSSATGTGTLVTATTTAATGPNDWGNTSNWSPSGVPANADDVYVENTSSSILYNIAQSGVTLNSLNVSLTFTGQIGLPRVNTSGYVEYRQTYLAIGATAINIGTGTGGGSGRIKIDVGTVATAAVVLGTGNPLEIGVEALLVKGNNASNTLEATKGAIGVAVFSGETATFNFIRVGYQTNIQGDVSLRCGAGVTLTDLEQSGGTVTLNNTVTTVNKTDGTLWVYNASACTTLTADGGTVNWLSTGTISTLNVGNKATVDFTKDMRARTVSACNLYAGGKILDTYKTVAWTAGIVLIRCSLPQVTIDVGFNRTLTIA